MKRKGFTLIELLAVIVILAIIALIATPIVMNLIENSRKGAAERSVDNYIDAVEVAVGTERIEGKVLDGEYAIQPDGNLCPAGETCDDTTEIKIEMSGNKPSGGTIFIENGIVTTDSVITIDGYEVKYDENESLKAEKIVDEDDSEGDSGDILTLSDVCRPVTKEGVDAVTTGNVPAGNYAYGDEYICDPGDGVERRFFVLEDGDTTTLTKTDGSVHYNSDGVGTASKGEISLIMNKDIGTSPYITLEEWQAAGGQCGQVYPDGTCGIWPVDSSFGPVTANKYLKSETKDKGWKTEVYLPTYDQLYAVNNNASLATTAWLLDDSVNEWGYWVSTSTKNIHYNWMALLGDYDILTDGFYSAVNANGIRPVITVVKD